jgi:hypothetical protein
MPSNHHPDSSELFGTSPDPRPHPHPDSSFRESGTDGARESEGIRTPAESRKLVHATANLVEAITHRANRRELFDPTLAACGEHVPTDALAATFGQAMVAKAGRALTPEITCQRCRTLVLASVTAWWAARAERQAKRRRRT